MLNRAKEVINFGKSQKKKWENKRTRELGNYYNTYHNKPIKENSVLLESYHAVTTTGNVYAIYHQLCQDKPELKKYWVYIDESPLSQAMKQDKNTSLVKYESKEYFELLATAKYLVNDTSFMPYFVKREGQVYVNTWHGTPLKTLGKDIINAGITDHKNIQRNILSTDYLMMPNHFTADKLVTSHDLNGILPSRVFITGNARVDRNFMDRNDLLLKYPVVSDKKVLLYAPTWKKSLEDTTEEDIQELVSQVDKLQSALGDDTQVLLKSHYFIYQNFVALGLADKVVPDWVDTNEFLGLVDGLITDYSSIFFDFLPNNKPIYFYMPDFEEYNNTRGMYLDVAGLPGEVYYEFEDLLRGVQQPTDVYLEATNANRQTYMQEFCAFDDGQASKRVVDIVFNQNHQYEEVSYKNDKKVLLFYSGGLFNNGITNSLINLTKLIDYDKYEVIVFDFDNINDVEKKNNLLRFDNRVKIIYKFGRVPQSYQDSVAVDLFYRRGAYGKNIKLDRVTRYFQTNFKRIFGELKPDTVIDFGGYNKVMTALISFSPVTNKLAFFHNLMDEEYNKMIGNKYKHRWNLKVIFSLYNYFDKIISVTDSANEQNKVAIQLIAPQIDIKKMDSLENLINGDEILKIIEDGKEINEQVSLNGMVLNKIDESDRVSTYTVVPSLEKNTINFVTAARFSPEKNHINIITAFKEITKHTPEARLHLLGDGPLYNETQQTILRLGLSDHVFLYGHLTNPQYFVSQCDCAVLFSNYEGQGLFLLEAMIAGLPVIGTDVPGIQSVIDSGNNGLLVPCTIEGITEGFNAYIYGKVPNKTFDYKQYNHNILDKFSSFIN